eukprot:gene4506-1236_t
MGVANNLSLCNPPPPQSLAKIDAKISGAVQRRGSWSRRASARAAFAPNGGRLLHALIDPTERTEYVLALRILAPLQLCVAAARHPPASGHTGDPQIDAMVQHGLRQSAPPDAFIDESVVAMSTGAAAIVWPVHQGGQPAYAQVCFSVPAHVAYTEAVTMLAVS